MDTTDKVKVEVALHPTDYDQLQAAASRAGIELNEFYALSMHIGMRETLTWRSASSGTVGDGSRKADPETLPDKN